MLSKVDDYELFWIEWIKLMVKNHRLLMLYIEYFFEQYKFRLTTIDCPWVNP